MIEPDGRNFINGVWIKGGGSPIESVNPYTGQVVWRGNSADQVDVDSAVQAAGDALPAWKRVEFEDRMEIVRSYCDLVSARRRDLIEAISAEIGKPMWEAETEVNSVIAKLEPGVESLRERCSTWRPVNTPSAVTRFLPIGAVGVIGPFNFPIHMPNVHIMPALLAGNTVVWKQTEAAPLAGSIVASLWAEAGLPAGVLNLLHGGGATGSLVSRHAGLKGVYFTGSEKVGRQIAIDNATSGKIVALEMGGNTPLVVWDSTDLRGAVWIAIQSCYVTSGQRCSSVRRLIVKTGDFGASFIEAFRDAVSRLVVGDPFGEPQPFMGPVVSAASAERVLFFQKSLIERGGVSILESTQVGDVPALLSPGIVDVSTCSYSQDEEVLGPLVTLRLVELFEDAVAEADRTRYGLAAALISEDPGLFEQFRNGVETGIVSWNAATTGNSGRAAFGGVKASGNYRPTGYYSCDYTTRAVGGTENETVPPATKLSPGVSL